MEYLEGSNLGDFPTWLGNFLKDQVYPRSTKQDYISTLIKEAASKTVKEAGDGTTTATVLAEALLSQVYEVSVKSNIREIKQGIDTAVAKVIEFTLVPATDTVPISYPESFCNIFHA